MITSSPASRSGHVCACNIIICAYIQVSILPRLHTLFKTSLPPGLETTVAIPQHYGRTENNSTRTGVFHVTPCGGWVTHVAVVSGWTGVSEIHGSSFWIQSFNASALYEFSMYYFHTFTFGLHAGTEYSGPHTPSVNFGGYQRFTSNYLSRAARQTVVSSHNLP